MSPRLLVEVGDLDDADGRGLGGELVQGSSDGDAFGRAEKPGAAADEAPLVVTLPGPLSSTLKCLALPGPKPLAPSHVDFPNGPQVRVQISDALNTSHHRIATSEFAADRWGQTT